MGMHLLKTWPSVFRAMKDGHKKADIRFNDRDYAVGDYLFLFDWDPTRGHSNGDILIVQVTHVLTGFGLKNGHVMMSVAELLPAEVHRVASKYLEANQPTAFGPDAPVVPAKVEVAIQDLAQNPQETHESQHR